MYSEYDTTYQYGGYDPYIYSDPADDRPIPEPDSTWVDPVKACRDYVKSLNKSCVLQGFEGLEDNNIYLLEVHPEYVELVSDNTEEENAPSDGDTLKTHVKFLNLNFIDQEEEDRNIPPKHDRIPSHTNLFQTLFTHKGMHKTVIEEDKTDVEEKEKVKVEPEILPEWVQDEWGNWYQSENVQHIEPNRKSEPTLPMKKHELKQGKSALFTMTGVDMIQNLQKVPFTLKVSRNQPEGEPEFLGTCKVKVPESFRRAVLSSSQLHGLLPTIAENSDNFPILDGDGNQVGTAKVTCTLTCFGNMVVNNLRHRENKGYAFEDTNLHYTREPKVESQYTDPTNLRAATHAMQTEVPFVEKSSKQILKECLNSSLVTADDKTKARLLSWNCHWNCVARKSIPKPPPEESNEYDEKALRTAILRHCNSLPRLWRKQKRICKMMREQGLEKKRPSVLDRLEALETESALDAMEALRDTMHKAQTLLDKGSLTSGRTLEKSKQSVDFESNTSRVTQNTY